MVQLRCSTCSDACELMCALPPRQMFETHMRAAAWSPKGDVLAIGVGGRVGQGRNRKDGTVRRQHFFGASSVPPPPGPNVSFPSSLTRTGTVTYLLEQTDGSCSIRGLCVCWC